MQKNDVGNQSPYGDFCTGLHSSQAIKSVILNQNIRILPIVLVSVTWFKRMMVFPVPYFGACHLARAQNNIYSYSGGMFMTMLPSAKKDIIRTREAAAMLKVTTQTIKNYW